jgi:ParB family chromosome partitioning protein
MIKTIPLNKLISSPRNVRRASDADADTRLAADIEARGLLQNLVVSPVAKPRGCFAVEAGGRRLRALQRLAEEDKLARNHEVNCLIIEGDDAAQEASLAENFQRLSMNPADECLAFQQLIEQGAEVEGIARRFGLTVRFVEGRLRLASLAPVIFEALGAGEISLDVAKAYASTCDRERQAHVFEQMSRGWSAAHPDSIRRMITQATVSASDRRARFVGEEAYVAAGGRIERDLFSDEDRAQWLDIALLERLASEKLEALAAQAAADQKLAFVKPSLDSWIGHSQMEGLRRVPVSKPAMTDEEAERVDALEAEMEELASALEGEALADQELSDAETRLARLSDEIEAIVNKPPVIDDALRPEVGAFLILDDRGRPKLDTNFYVPIQAAGEPCRSDDVSEDGEPGGATGAGKGDLSQRLLNELAIQRRDILAVHVAADAGFALDLAIFLMVDRASGHVCEKSGSSLLALPPTNPIGFETPEAAASIARAEARDALDRNWMSGTTRAERFDSFRALPEEARAAWLGDAVASTLEASLAHPGERACAFHDHLGRLLGIETAQWWRPTGVNYFDRVPKRAALAALADVGGPALAERYAKARKVELAQACERIFSGDFIGEMEAKARAIDWVPQVMRFTVPAEAPEGEETELPGPEFGTTGGDTEAGAPPIISYSEQVEEAA